MAVASFAELLVDPDDRLDFLEAVGAAGETPHSLSPQETARRMGGLVDQMSPEDLVSNLSRYCHGFTAMLDDIVRVLEEVETPVVGQCQLRVLDDDLNMSALRSTWAFDPDGKITVGGEDEALLASRIAELVSTVDFWELMSPRYTMEETPISEMLRRDALMDPAEGFIADTFRRPTNQVSAADMAALWELVEEVETSRDRPILTRFPSMNLALETLWTALDDTYGQARFQGSSVRGWGLSEEMESLATQIHQCLEEVDAFLQASSGIKRVEAMLADFVQTEFWRHRWRIYEIWVLVRMMECLSAHGAAIELHDVSDGVWNIRYGRATTPCAVAHFDSGDLDIYYQFYKTNDRGRSSMPDIVLMEGRRAAAGALAVIDPKHGRSYSKGRVRRTLRRYSKEHGAALTAVVNYYPVPGYQFDHQADGVRHEVLASDVQPGSLATQQFELVLAEVLTSRNYRRQDQDPTNRSVTR